MFLTKGISYNVHDKAFQFPIRGRDGENWEIHSLVPETTRSNGVTILKSKETSSIRNKPNQAIIEKKVVSKPSLKYKRPVDFGEIRLPSNASVPFLYQPGESLLLQLSLQSRLVLFKIKQRRV